MKSEPEIIGHLQGVLKVELAAINQYFLHYRLLRHWGLEGLGKKAYRRSIADMKHADALMDRIFILEGLPNLQDLGKLRVGEDVAEVLACDLALEMALCQALRSGIGDSESARDYVSRDLFRRLLDEAEEQVDFIETQMALIEKTGLQNYIQSQIGSDRRQG